jgi:VWFA-related protein
MLRLWRAALLLGAGLQAGAEPPEFTVSSRLVQVNVVVRDRNGPVSGLTKGDFVLYERGKPQAIAVFSVEDSRTPKPVGTPLPRNVFSNRIDDQPATPVSVTAILFDSLNTRFEDQSKAKEELKLLFKKLRPREPMALYVLGLDLKLLRDYTSDPLDLLAALDRFRGGASSILVSAAPSAMDSLHEDGNPDAILPKVAEIHTRDSYAMERVRRTLEALDVIAGQLAVVPGRKNLIWVSGSFPASIGADGAVTPYVSRVSRVLDEEIAQTARSLSRAGVAIYPVDARGVIGYGDLGRILMGDPMESVGGPTPGAGYAGLATMEDLARRTGGKAFYNSNDIEGAVRQAMDDSEVTYNLGFYPPPEALDGKWHDLRVEVRGKGVSVRCRRSYLAVENETRAGEAPEVKLVNAMRNPLDSSALGLTVRLEKTTNPSNYLAQVTVDPRQVSLELKEGRWTGVLDIVYLAQGADGEVLNSIGESLQLHLSAQRHNSVLKSGLQLKKTIRCPEGTQMLRVVALDRNTGMAGSLRIRLAEVN